jgi:hypothetical protein
MRHLRHPLAPWKVYDSCVAVLSNLSLLLVSGASDDSIITRVKVVLMKLQVYERSETVQNKPEG